MKAKIALIVGGAAFCCVLVASCGGGEASSTYVAPPAPPATAPPSKTTDLDTADLLAIVQTETSDTTEPFQVDGGAIAVVPVGDETSAPISVDAT